MWVMRRGGPTWHHVIIHEAAKSWEEIRAEVEARERVNGFKPEWVYHGTHDQRPERLLHHRRAFALGHDLRLQPRVVSLPWRAQLWGRRRRVVAVRCAADDDGDQNREQDREHPKGHDGHADCSKRGE